MVMVGPSWGVYLIDYRSQEPQNPDSHMSEVVLEIALSTLHRPRVLFLDEPTVGLDPIARDAVWKHLTDLRNAYGMTLFFTTHYLEEAESHCDRIAIMHLGKLAALGTCMELEASLGGGHTLNDVFTRYAGNAFRVAKCSEICGGAFRPSSIKFRHDSRGR